MKVVDKVIAWMENHIGDTYSRTYRWASNKHDCSSAVFKAFRDAGVELVHKSTGGRVTTSMYEVYAKGFELVYPETYSQIGKKLPVKRGLLRKLDVQPGDLAFYNFDKDTERYNKITHISVVRSITQGIIHALNPREGLTTDNIDWGSDRICAVIRYIPKEPVKALKRELKKTVPVMSGRDVEAVQQVLADEGISVGKHGVDGKYGKDTKAAVKAFQAMRGMKATGVVDMETTIELGFAWERPDVVSRLLYRRRPTIKGDDVSIVQSKLEQFDISVGEFGIDGKFGPDTEKAVRTFQNLKGLKVDGIVGVMTTTALGLTWAG